MSTFLIITGTVSALVAGVVGGFFAPHDPFFAAWGAVFSFAALIGIVLNYRE